MMSSPTINRCREVNPTGLTTAADILQMSASVGIKIAVQAIIKRDNVDFDRGIASADNASKHYLVDVSLIPGHTSIRNVELNKIKAPCPPINAAQRDAHVEAILTRDDTHQSLLQHKMHLEDFTDFSNQPPEGNAQSSCPWTRGISICLCEAGILLAVDTISICCQTNRDAESRV